MPSFAVALGLIAGYPDTTPTSGTTIAGVVPTFTLLAEEELLAADDGLVTWLVGQSAVIVDAANPGAALNGVGRPPTRAPAVNDAS
jgi:hypothetical protein